MRSGAPLRLAAALGAVAIAGAPASARAEPQGTVGLTIGGSGAGTGGAFWDHAEFHLGLRGDVLFGRERNDDYGAGPFVEIGTFALDELQFGGGVSALFPVLEDFPIVGSLGAYGRVGQDAFGVEPGISAALFWGTRSYNFHASYTMAAGLLVGFRQSLGSSEESHLLVAAQIDLAALALPFVALTNVLRGPSAEAAPLAGD